MKTFNAKLDTVKRRWYMIDAKGKTLGRIASRIALILRGKHKPEYTPYIDTGDYVIVVNASNIKVTGRKFEQKMYYRHTGYPGGIKKQNYAKLYDKSPENIIKFAVKGMLPRNTLGRIMFKKLKVYTDNHHPHTAQQVKTLDTLV